MFVAIAAMSFASCGNNNQSAATRAQLLQLTLTQQLSTQLTALLLLQTLLLLLLTQLLRLSNR